MKSAVISYLAGRAARREYWATLGALVVGIIAAWALGDVASGMPSTAIMLFVIAVHALQTVRRLHDAGYSRWWAVLLAFPFSVTIDPAGFTIHAFKIQFIDISQLIRSVPFVLGLVAPSNAVLRDEERDSHSGRVASKAVVPHG